MPEASGTASDDARPACTPADVSAACTSAYVLSADISAAHASADASSAVWTDASTTSGAPAARTDAS